MSKFKMNAEPVADKAATEVEDQAGHEAEEQKDGFDEFTVKAATVGVVAVGALLIEATLLPGIAIGVAAILAPKYLPKLGSRLQPLFASTVRGAYKVGRKARAAVGEAQEHVNDLVAEVHAEEAAKTAGAGQTASA